MSVLQVKNLPLLPDYTDIGVEKQTFFIKRELSHSKKGGAGVALDAVIWVSPITP